MKNMVVLGIVFLSLVSCKKLVEQTGEDIVVKAMTDGQWRVVRFSRDAVDVTTGFAPYLFQFRADRTVEALNNGAVENRGTWEAKATDQTISSNFTNANATVSLLNGTWKVTKNSWTFVEATLTVNNEVRNLRLEKQ